MNPNKALLLVLLCALVAVGVAVLFRGPHDDQSQPAIVGPSSTSARPSVHAAEQVELSGAPATDPRASEGLAPPPMTTIAGEVKTATGQDWATKYAGLSSKEILSQRKELNEKLGELAWPDLKKRYDAGQYEFLHCGHSTGSNGGEWNPELVMTLSIVPATANCPDGEVRRTVLPESQFPELYAMRREERWLDKRYYEVQGEEGLAKQPK